MAMAADAAMKTSVHLRPISANRIMVSDREFHGLAIKKAMTCASDAPRS